jgi:asparagine synthetase B (glutamine-hydrolysing)
MCGICGMVTPGVNGLGRRTVAARLRHRVPDETGVFVGDGVALRERAESARKRLAEQGERLRQLRIRHSGELTDQQLGNAPTLAGYQAEL